jgi:hypothetical protein
MTVEGLSNRVSTEQATWRAARAGALAIAVVSCRSVESNCKEYCKGCQEQCAGVRGYILDKVESGLQSRLSLVKLGALRLLEGQIAWIGRFKEATSTGWTAMSWSV